MADKELQLNASPQSGTSKDIRLCLYVTLVCNFFILLGKPLQTDFIVSWATRPLILLVCAMVVLAIINLLRKVLIDASDVCFLAVICLSAISMLLSGVSGMLSAAVPYLCF